MRAGIRRINLVGGQPLELSATDGLFLLTGANNSGKTRFLLECYQSLNGNNVAQAKVVENSLLYKTGTHSELIDRIEKKGVRQNGDWNFATITIGGNFEGFFESTGMNGLERVIVSQLTTSARLSLSNPAVAIDFHREPRSHPLHHLHRSEERRSLLSRHFKRAFGTEIALDLLGSKVIPMHVGDGAETRMNETITGDAYLERLRSLPRLEDQGDGMKSFVGIILNIVFGDHDIVFLDEPEAFLHPPQARLLGSILARERPSNMQLFIATHSADFIRGCLEGTAANLRIARINRIPAGARVVELPQEELRQSWSDPVLRFSNVIEGLFHEKVIVCEADGDCRFYAAIAEALRESEDHAFVRDLLFVQSGGKGGIPKLVRALRALSVPIAAVVDFDVLSQTGQLRAILQALGSNFDQFAEDVAAVRADIDKLGGKPTVREAKSSLAQILDSIPDEAEEMPRSIEKRIKDCVRLPPGWARAKSSGVGMLDRSVQQTALRLLARFRDVGLFVVPTGELESFDISETSDKNAWVNAVLARYQSDMATAETLNSARRFVASFIER